MKTEKAMSSFSRNRSQGFLFTLSAIADQFREAFDKKLVIFLVVAGILIHGEMAFNKLTWFDDVTATVYQGFSVKAGLRHGRWFYSILLKLLKTFFLNNSIPVIICLISFFFMALSACLIFSMFHISSKIERALLGILFITIPAVAGNFGYMSTAGYNFFGIFLCVLAAFILSLDQCQTRKSTAVKYVLSILLAACAIGEYQCYLAMYLSLLLLLLIQKSIQEQISFLNFIKTGILYILTALSALIIYLVMMKASLAATGIKLTNYRKTNTLGIVSPAEYAKRVLAAYRVFFKPSELGSGNVFPAVSENYFLILVIVICLLTLCAIVQNIRSGKFVTASEIALGMLLLPLAISFNVVLYGASPVHSLHMYHALILFVTPFVLFHNLSIRNAAQAKTVYIVLCVISLFWGIVYITYTNNLYMRNEIRQSAAQSYFTRLTSRIESTEGYDDQLPVLVIGEPDESTIIDKAIWQGGSVRTNPYHFSIISSYNWKKYAEMWCGYKPNYVKDSPLTEDERVAAMPIYPDDGSIQIIDGTLVVKFSDPS